jgi:hypothetical protein
VHICKETKHTMTTVAATIQMYENKWWTLTKGVLLDIKFSSVYLHSSWGLLYMQIPLSMYLCASLFTQQCQYTSVRFYCFNNYQSVPMAHYHIQTAILHVTRFSHNHNMLPKISCMLPLFNMHYDKMVGQSFLKLRQW